MDKNMEKKIRVLLKNNSAKQLFTVMDLTT